MADPPKVHNFDVYGFRFSIQSSVEDVLQGLRQDFEFFLSNAEPEFEINLFDEQPPLDRVPLTDAVMYTPRNVVYINSGERFIDYHGRALGIQNVKSRNFALYSVDVNLLYEGAYLYLLAEIGKYLDARGLHRIHALGVAFCERAVLVLLPMGGGKSTLGLHLLKSHDVRLLSDDSPFLSRKGDVLAYPLRIGLLPGSEEAIPAEHRRSVERMEFGLKHLVNYAFFKDRVEASATPGIVFVGARTMAKSCIIEEISFATGLRACISNCVVGVGLFQGVEFILQASPWELFKKIGLGASRLLNCWHLIGRSTVCRIHLGRDQELNAQTLLHYLRNRLECEPSPSSNAMPVMHSRDAAK